MMLNLRLLTTYMLLLTTAILFSQSSASYNRFQDEYNTWSIGAGLSVFNMHGDLRSFDTYSGEAYYNLGGYISGQKMFNPIVGAELKFNISKLGGEVQRLYTSGDALTQTYYAILYADQYAKNVLYIDGLAYGLEGNLIVNLTNIWQRVPRKWSWSLYLGAGYHRYNSRLIIKNFKGNTQEDPYTIDDVTPEGIIKDADFGYNSSRDNKNAAGSLYLNLGTGVKYKLSQRFEIEGRINLGVNNEDHLDAAISQKQVYESFITPNIGVVYNLGKKKESAVWSFDHKTNNSTNDKIDLEDNDNDGVVDLFDKELNTPINAEVYGSGIAIDSDKDGLQDYKDKCPLKPGPLDKLGCPVEKKVVQKIEDTVVKPAVYDESQKEDIIEQITLLSKSIYFKSGSDELKVASYKSLNDISNIMFDYPESKYKIEGHTDSYGNDSYNLDLSDRRAKSVKRYLLNKNIEENRLTSIGFGETKPIAPNTTEKGRQTNRRVEINFIDPNSKEGKLVYADGVTFTKNKIGDDNSNIRILNLLQSDSDGDGVPDFYDKEPNTPRESKVYGNGVSVDSDRDNIPDFKDKCPFKIGSLTNEGCPTSDLLVATDDCVEEKGGVSNCNKLSNKIAKPKMNNIALDSIYKSELTEVDKLEQIDLQKRSNTTEEQKQIAIKHMFDKIKFSRSESNRLRSVNIELVLLVSKMIIDYRGNERFSIEIHTDDKPNKVYNKEISKRRAFAIKQQLLKNGVPKEKFEVIGMGADRMKYNRDIKTENIKNNRIEVRMK